MSFFSLSNNSANTTLIHTSCMFKCVQRGEGTLGNSPPQKLCHNESLHVIVTTKWLLTSGPSNCTLLPPLFLLCRINPTECSQIAFRGGVVRPRSPSDLRFTSHCFYSQIQSRLKTSNQSVPITLQARILLPSLPLRITAVQTSLAVQARILLALLPLRINVQRRGDSFNREKNRLPHILTSNGGLSLAYWLKHWIADRKVQVPVPLAA